MQHVNSWRHWWVSLTTKNTLNISIGESGYGSTCSSFVNFLEGWQDKVVLTEVSESAAGSADSDFLPVSTFILHLCLLADCSEPFPVAISPFCGLFASLILWYAATSCAKQALYETGCTTGVPSWHIIYGRSFWKITSLCLMTVWLPTAQLCCETT